MTDYAHINKPLTQVIYNSQHATCNIFFMLLFSVKCELTPFLSPPPPCPTSCYIYAHWTDISAWLLCSHQKTFNPSNLQLTACNVQHNISCFCFPPYPTACLIYAYNWRQCVTVMPSLKNLLLPHAFTTHSTQDASHTCKNSKPFFTIYGCGQKRQRGPFQLVAGSLFILCGWENQQEAAAERRGGGDRKSVV